jgi:DNA-binding transcriptional LysR family regulator
VSSLFRPVTGKSAVSITDLAGEHLLQHPDAVPEWRDIATELRRRRRTAPPRFSNIVEEKLEHVATERGIAVLPSSTATYYQRPDIAYVLVSDIPPSEVALAYSSSRRSPLIAEFARIAVDRP